ncbi:type IV toxin-antitoxin system AbiEi family antitoxin domain-containing protein [Microbacterium arborescens]|uniref:type IV toxin-antitoxin system AbiEi family antitoxin domain-containing protein n=1 Tax=Microbacterium arborescens TaxID=33883 RepID=UPI0025A2887C|nr:type IV toxin-antitoxin system AbiEi family antitoxin domain-containing protein [Microbacterium arborescens]WJM15383.1 type IV toxin-antitoxin system AbiEi family antitoxin domain-containing protein [Microbacterium arborescens]
MTEHDDLILRRDARRHGEASTLDRAVADGELVRVRRGVYVAASRWAAARPEERMRLRALALAAVATRDPVFSHATAAALHGLPVHRGDDARVHTLELGPAPAPSRSDVVRHRHEVIASDITSVDALQATNIARTLFDVLCAERAETATAAMDAALRAVAWQGRGVYDRAAAAALVADVAGRIERAPGARGIRRARFVVSIADGRAQLPGESISRLWMQQLGATEPTLQHPVALGGGRWAFLDFAWPRLRRFGEFDGDGKYVDPAFTAGRSPRDVLREQRDRESRIVAATGWTPIRWGWERLASRPTFAAFLRAHALLR